MIDAILTNTVLPRISEELLTRSLSGSAVSRVSIGVQNDEFTYDFD